MPLRTTADKIKSKVEYLLKKLYILSPLKKVQSETNRIVTEAEISRQTEILERTLRERENRIMHEQSSKNNIKQRKDVVRQNVYTTLKERSKKSTNNFTK